MSGFCDPSKFRAGKYADLVLQHARDRGAPPGSASPSIFNFSIFLTEAGPKKSNSPQLKVSFFEALLRGKRGFVDIGGVRSFIPAHLAFQNSLSLSVPARHPDLKPPT